MGSFGIKGSVIFYADGPNIQFMHYPAKLGIAITGESVLMIAPDIQAGARCLNQRWSKPSVWISSSRQARR
jgi:hypothetical protein